MIAAQALAAVLVVLRVVLYTFSEQNKLIHTNPRKIREVISIRIQNFGWLSSFFRIMGPKFLRKKIK